MIGSARITIVRNVTIDRELDMVLRKIIAERMVSCGAARGIVSDLLEEALKLYLSGMVHCTHCGYPFYSPQDVLVDTCPNCGKVIHIRRSDHPDI